MKLVMEGRYVFERLLFFLLGIWQGVAGVGGLSCRISLIYLLSLVQS